MSPTLKLYYFPMACSVAPHLLLEDSGLPYESVKQNIRDPSTREAYVKNVNPKGQVPALSIDGQVITEMPAIMTAIAQLVPSKNYTGSTPQETIRFYEWIGYLSSAVHAKVFGSIFAPQKQTTEEAAQESVKAKAKENAKTALAFIEEKLAARTTKFAFGETLSGVDAYLAVFVGWSKLFGLWDEKAYPSYAALFARIAELEAWKKVMEHNAM